MTKLTSGNGFANITPKAPGSHDGNKDPLYILLLLLLLYMDD